MTTLIQILSFLIHVLGSLYLSVILLRFLLQVARADFYNPISQQLVKLTNPVLMPLRKVIPGFWGLDLACVVFAILFHWFAMQLFLLVNGQPFFPPHYMLAWSLVGIILNVCTLYTVAGIVMVIASFIAPYSSHPILVLIRQLMEPVLAPFRRIIPSTGGLDLSLFFLMITLVVIRMTVQGIGATFNTPFAALIGYNF